MFPSIGGDVGSIKEAAFTPRNPGGQRHKLHLVLAGLSSENVTDLREILNSDPSDVNWTALAAAMSELGFRHSVSTWQRWGRDLAADPARFA